MASGPTKLITLPPTIMEVDVMVSGKTSWLYKQVVNSTSMFLAGRVINHDIYHDCVLVKQLAVARSQMLYSLSHSLRCQEKRKCMRSQATKNPNLPRGLIRWTKSFGLYYIDEAPCFKVASSVTG